MAHSTQKSILRRYRQLAPTASVRVSPICLGTMNFGDKMIEKYGECSKETAFAILDHYYGQGGNFLDTANGYQHGQSEEWVGEWLTSRGNRDQIVLATKYTTGFKGDQPDLIQANFGGNGMKSLRLSVEASLKKLQTSYVDILYVHWWDYTVSIPELMLGLNDLVSAGKVLYLGISDTPAWVVSKANQYARDHGLRQFVVYQGLWNAAMRDFERDIIPMCHDEGMGLCPYGALNQGRFQTAQVFKEREKHNPGRNMKPTTVRDRQVSLVLEKIAGERGLDLRQVALAYVYYKAPYVTPIIGGRKLEHLKSNIAGLGVSLTDDEIAAIDAAFPFDHGFPHTFLSGSLFEENAAPRGAFGPEDVWLTKHQGEFDWVKAPKPVVPALTQD